MSSIAQIKAKYFVNEELRADMERYQERYIKAIGHVVESELGEALNDLFNACKKFYHNKCAEAKDLDELKAYQSAIASIDFFLDHMESAYDEYKNEQEEVRIKERLEEETTRTLNELREGGEIRAEDIGPSA